MKNIYEVFDEFKQAKNTEERRNVLLSNASEDLKIILQGAFHPGIKFLVSGRPENYKPSDAPAGLSYVNMTNAVKNFYLFVEGSKKSPPNLSLQRRWELYTQLLESMEEKEAEVIINMTNKNLAIRHLDAKLVKSVFPDIFP